MLTWNPDSIQYVNVPGTDIDLMYAEGSCLDADTLPTDGIYNGSNVLVMDKSIVKAFDQASKQWKAL